ncbi:unnamed protein product [Peronospora farinosa]|uniref:Uncharacterized protein n=1 Tax=Peronospora farinosa TaxID=134698 RepID=A0AAV0TIT4_9STRA|nr:unnamed protein product [Peronospora farinosa]CAI5722259.1 unnamed protein product [Peronospora farinosa]
MADCHQVRGNDSKIDGTAEDKKDVQCDAEDTTSGYDDFCLLTSSIIKLDPKDVLIIKDGTVRVAESLDREQLDANGTAVKASGSWTKAEHERFLCAMKTFPKGPWKAIAEMVGTRTVRQTQTHAQKYREKLARRMRGLRNRNGTLQNPPMAGMAGYPHYIIPSYTSMHEHGYQHAAHSGKTGYTSTATLARTSSLPSMPLHSLPLDHNHTPYVSTALPVSIAMVSSEFSQMSTSMTSPSAVIENGIYLSPWETNGAENKPTVPDFDESMDFLMDVYSSNPSEINTVMPSQSIGMTVTPTACIPRAPPTPMSSLVMKRHPGYGLIQQERRHAKLDMREQEVKAYDST